VSLAYRFLPLDREDQPRGESQYVVMSEREPTVGDRVDARLLGYEVWEVVERRSGTAGAASVLLAVADPDGRDVPPAGTLICRGVN
jgi:hypothetical protein